MQPRDRQGKRPYRPSFAPGLRAPLAAGGSRSRRSALAPSACPQNVSKKEPHGSSSTTGASRPASSTLRPRRSPLPRSARPLRRVAPPPFSAAMFAASSCVSGPVSPTVAAPSAVSHRAGRAGGLPCLSKVAESRPAEAETPSLSILVVDDEPSVRETLAEMLEVMGHRVELADSGHQAIQKLAGNHCDLVFTDLAMPEMDGWEMSREIRKRWPDLSVVLVTGYGTGTLPPSGESDLVNGVIGKPFDFSQISQTITAIVASQPALVTSRV